MIEGLASEVDTVRRNDTVARIWKRVQGDIVYLAIHNQVLNWSMKDSIRFDVQSEDQPYFKYMTFVR